MKKPITEFKLEHRGKKELRSLLMEHIYHSSIRDYSRAELIEFIKFLREKIKEKGKE